MSRKKLKMDQTDRQRINNSPAITKEDKINCDQGDFTISGGKSVNVDKISEKPR